MGDLDQIEVVAEILSARATQINVGDPVEVFGEAIGAKPIAGQVKRIFPAGFEKVSSLGVEQQRVNVVIALEKRPARLGVGFRVYVRIIYATAADVLTIPRTALLRTRDGGWQVLEVQNGRTKFTGVTVGLMNDDQVEVKEGLSPKSQVVAQPTSELEADQKVTTERQ